MIYYCVGYFWCPSMKCWKLWPIQLVHFLGKWWNINITRVATVLCKQPFFKAQVWQKIHVCCDIFTSRCRMTIIFYWRTLWMSRSTLNSHIMCLKWFLMRTQSFKVSPLTKNGSKSQSCAYSKSRPESVLKAIFHVNFTFAAKFSLLRAVCP